MNNNRPYSSYLKIRFGSVLAIAIGIVFYLILEKNGLKDTSYIANYLRWQYSEVSWQTLGGGKTRVTWRLGYERKLDPIWYFGPLQSVYTRLCAGYLIDNLLEPTGV